MLMPGKVIVCQMNLSLGDPQPQAGDRGQRQTWSGACLNFPLTSFWGPKERVLLRALTVQAWGPEFQKAIECHVLVIPALRKGKVSGSLGLAGQATLSVHQVPGCEGNQMDST